MTLLLVIVGIVAIVFYYIYQFQKKIDKMANALNHDDDLVQQALNIKKEQEKLRQLLKKQIELRNKIRFDEEDDEKTAISDYNLVKSWCEKNNPSIIKLSDGKTWVDIIDATKAMLSRIDNAKKIFADKLEGAYSDYFDD